MEPLSLPLHSLSLPAFTSPLLRQVINSGPRESLKRATFAAVTPSAEGERNKQRLFCCQIRPEARESPLARLGVPWPLSNWVLCLAEDEHCPGVPRCPACTAQAHILVQPPVQDHSPHTHYCILSPTARPFQDTCGQVPAGTALPRTS